MLFLPMVFWFQSWGIRPHLSLPSRIPELRSSLKHPDSPSVAFLSLVYLALGHLSCLHWGQRHLDKPIFTGALQMPVGSAVSVPGIPGALFLSMRPRFQQQLLPRAPRQLPPAIPLPACQSPLAEERGTSRTWSRMPGPRAI